MFSFIGYKCPVCGKPFAEGDDIVVEGVERLRGGVSLDGYNDHRMVMLLSLAATLAEKPVTVQGVEALNKSWPEYLTAYASLGGKMA